LDKVDIVAVLRGNWEDFGGKKGVQWKEKVRNMSWIVLDNVDKVAKKGVIVGQTHTGNRLVFEAHNY